MKKSAYRYHQSKLKIKNILIVIICICLLCVTIYFHLTRIKLMIKGYGFDAQNIILSLDDEQIDEYLLYDGKIDFDMWDQVKNQKHYYDYQYYSQLYKEKSYQDIVKEIDQFYQLYERKLSTLKYDIPLCRELMKTYSIHDISNLTNYPYTYQQVKDYLKINGCIIEDIPKYIQTKKEPLEAVLSVSYPFIDSHNKVNHQYIINEPEHYLILIKKGFQISSEYVPSDLIKVNIPIAPDNTHDMLRKDAANALKQMYDDALKLNYHLVLNSGYRSYNEQKKLYDYYFTIYDEVTASGLVAIPGTSEHQLGLGVDLTSQSIIDEQRMVFGDTEEYKWVVQNAHLYGFILRYPKDRSATTGTANEPWHLRYVGKTVAKEIYDHQWTLEDYILHHGFDYHISRK